MKYIDLPFTMHIIEQKVNSIVYVYSKCKRIYNI